MSNPVSFRITRGPPTASAQAFRGRQGTGKGKRNDDDESDSDSDNDDGDGDRRRRNREREREERIDGIVDGRGVRWVCLSFSLEGMLASHSRSRFSKLTFLQSILIS